ncbi:hypothetical protein BD560DRAFT_417859 [Blakeslea trispora]|nr:hypothetical protein BD560DRAFT_417859 [Blakeslea trispora]
MKIDSLEIAIKKFENQDIASSDFVTIWHQLCKTKQELVLLEEEEQRLLSNLEQKLYKLERALKNAEPGHHALLMQQKKTITMLQSIAFAEFGIFLSPSPSPLLPPSLPLRVNEISSSQDVVDGDKRDYGSDHESDSSEDDRESLSFESDED